MAVTVVSGPDWCTPGLSTKGGRYPLGVEAPIMRMIDVLVPGVSTQTVYSRYFSLYWALGEFSRRHDLDTAQCRTLLRRAEVGLGLQSLLDPETGNLTGEGQMHGAVRIRSVTGRSVPLTELPELGENAYTPRVWGYWSQYSGPCFALQSVSIADRALRAGEVQCPHQVSAMFADLFDVCMNRPVGLEDLRALPDMTMWGPQSPDTEALRGLLLGRPQLHEPTGDDHTRRSAFRLLGRAVQLADDPAASWTSILLQVLAYGPHLADDPLLAEEERAAAWRGALLRHQGVGAWRRLWSSLVDQVWFAAEPSTRRGLHEWIRSEVRDMPLASFIAELPPTLDADRHPYPAEPEISENLPPIEGALAILLLGAARAEEFDDERVSLAFHGGSERKQFLDPGWVGRRRDDHAGRSLGDFAAGLLDDMLAQARRIALRKTSVVNGNLVMATKLHEREGRYFASGREGGGNIGLRTEQIGSLAVQLGVFDLDADGVGTITAQGRRILDLPA